MAACDRLPNEAGIPYGFWAASIRTCRVGLIEQGEQRSRQATTVMPRISLISPQPPGFSSSSDSRSYYKSSTLSPSLRRIRRIRINLRFCALVDGYTPLGELLARGGAIMLL